MKKSKALFITIPVLVCGFVLYVITIPSVITIDTNDLSDGLQKIEFGRVESRQDYTIVINKKNSLFYSFIPTKNIVFKNHEVEILFVESPDIITLYRRIPSIAAQWREIIKIPITSSFFHPHQLSFTLDCDACAIISTKPDHNGAPQAPIILDLSKLT